MSTIQNAYALLVGVGNDLPVTVKDATAINNILADEKLAGYKPENIFLVTGEQATRKGILEAFDKLISQTDEDSSVVLFYSGHGGFYEPWNQFYLVPYNFDPENYEETWIKAEELKEKVNAIASRKLVLFLDCCHAAGMTKSGASINGDKVAALKNADELARKIDDGKGMSIISSCREDQLSYIMEGDLNSLFTKTLIEVLKGKHKQNFDEQYIRISEVIQYIFKKVPESNPDQKPYANLQIYDDFVLSYVPEIIRKDIPAPQKDGRMSEFIQMEIDDLFDSLKRKSKKQKFLKDQRDIQSDSAMKYTLDMQIFEIDEEKTELTKKIEVLKFSLNQ